MKYPTIFDKHLSKITPNNALIYKILHNEISDYPTHTTTIYRSKKKSFFGNNLKK